ncbi:hypothetical protein LDL08_21290 [Nonomuraea glycinis]|uniref:Uncharacterized protein n=1 Tax=Nonomuraea glycinis TaxID=2047744 RepID=A0A918A519_9ACTN|nr:hypothetical protein [Nonomuraea glycinis]MCA2178728.1 hypothetical protein [Nonomuraea glycinis]GGP07960.1 hypothetical protein GCM10012278_37560 [Nonomuraea glycinis]
MVVGPNELPILREAQDVLASPEIATLSAITRPHDVETVVAVATTLATFDDERGLIHIESCADTGKLLGWTKKAATASSVEEIFAD